MRVRAFSPVRTALLLPGTDYWKDTLLDPAWKVPPEAMKREVEQGGGWITDRFGLCQSLPLARLQAVTEGLRDKLHNGWGAVRGSVSDTSLDSRVALRLRWDSDMAGADVQVRLTGPSVVELTGVVADLAQRRRAIELAGTTTGVESVRDRLRVEADADKP